MKRTRRTDYPKGFFTELMRKADWPKGFACSYTPPKHKPTPPRRRSNAITIPTIKDMRPRV